MSLATTWGMAQWQTLRGIGSLRLKPPNLFWSTLSLPCSKSTFSNPLKENLCKWGSENCYWTIFHQRNPWWSNVLHTAWCYISGEAAGEIWNWSLLEVKGFDEELSSSSQYFLSLVQCRGLLGPAPVSGHLLLPVVKAFDTHDRWKSLGAWHSSRFFHRLMLWQLRGGFLLSVSKRKDELRCHASKDPLPFQHGLISCQVSSVSTASDWPQKIETGYPIPKFPHSCEASAPPHNEVVLLTYSAVVLLFRLQCWR